MYTIKDFEKEAPAWIVERFKRNFDRELTGSILSEYAQCDMKRFIFSAFFWVATPEGEDFWLSVYKGNWPDEPKAKQEEKEMNKSEVIMSRVTLQPENGRKVEVDNNGGDISIDDSVWLRSRKQVEELIATLEQALEYWRGE